MNDKVPVFSGSQAIESLRESDFDTCSALGEVVDNALQAGARHIRIQTVEQELPAQGRRPAGTRRIIGLAVGDDGSGMDPGTLHYCMQLGYSSRYNDRSGIGRFGVGMTLAAISQCRRIEVYSRETPESDWMYTRVDLDEIPKDPFIPFPVAKKLPDNYKELVGARGTLVIWAKCDRIVDNAEEIAHYLARTYRKFIGGQVVDGGIVIPNPDPRSIYFNGSKVEAFDVLYHVRGRDFPDGDTAKLMEPILIEMPVPPDILGGAKVSVIRVQMSLLPEAWRAQGGGGSGRSELSKKLRLGENEGFSVLRAGREVFYDTMPHFEPKPHADGLDRWWAAEVSFEPVLDHYFSVKNIKRGARFIAQLRERIQDEMRPTILEARKEVKAVWDRNRVKQNVDGVDVTTEHTEAENINKNVKLPPGKAGANKPPEVKKKEVDDILRGVLANEDQLAAWRAKIESQPCTIIDEAGTQWKGSTFMDIHPQGGRTIIEYNRGHSFFMYVYTTIQRIQEAKTVEEAQAEARKLKVALDLLFMSYASAEAQVSPDETQRVGDTFDFLKTVWGQFLDRLVKELERRG